MRKLAKIVKIDDLVPIENADFIELAKWGGWQCVVKKGEFSVGELVVALEIDSWVPTELAPFLTKEGKEPREFNGVKGERLRTIKLRGQLSQGLILPIFPLYQVFQFTRDMLEGDDVTSFLGIQKWERPVNAQMAGTMRGNFPGFIPKTDQERAQNLVSEILSAVESGMEFERTEKLEGSSITIYLFDDDFGVCSRNIDLKETEGNAFWEVARRYNVEDSLRAACGNYAIQGELIGPGIQGNIYGLNQTDLYVYDVYDIQCGGYMLPEDRERFVASIGLKHAPILDRRIKLDTVTGLLLRAEGKSALADTLREGDVYKQVNGGMTLKVVSNMYLLLHGD